VSNVPDAHLPRALESLRAVPNGKRRRRAVIRGLAIFLMVVALTGNVLWIGMAAPRLLGANFPVPPRIWFLFFFGLAESVALLIGSVGLFLLRAWGGALTMAVSGAEIVYSMVEFAYDLNLVGPLFQLIPLAVIILILRMWRELRPAGGGTS